MKKKNNEIMIVSQVYEEAYIWGEDMQNLKQTIKRLKMFVKSKVEKQSAEC